MLMGKVFTLNRVTAIVIASMYFSETNATEFNTDVLSSIDRDNIDFSRFSKAGYIMPGVYDLYITVNGQAIAPYSFSVQVIDYNGESKVCLTPNIVERIAFKAEYLEKIHWWNNSKCASIDDLPGVEFKSAIHEGKLNINIPKLLLEYSDSTWDPPSRWDDGISGVLFDYNLNAYSNKTDSGSSNNVLSYYGTVGGNYNVWRLRADYQGSLTNSQGDNALKFNRVYLYRALPEYGAKLSIGENYVNSDIFSSWNYTGLSIESDTRMLPPKFRGYAPEVTGIAETNARVIITQQGRLLYDSTVPAGEFSIRELDSSIRGKLDVEIIEQDGRKRTFQVDTAYVPYLTRPGHTRYKIVAGRSRTSERNMEGPVFTGGELSWGINNNWTLFGGGILSDKYNSLAIGIGRDLKTFGAVSADIIQSFADMKGNDKKQGKSIRLSYSKRFDDYNTDITFAGYRFTDRNFMSMQQYLDNVYRHNTNSREKQLYTATINKNIPSIQSTLSLQYSWQSYWEHSVSKYYTLSFNRYFDAFDMKGLSIGVSASRSKYHEKDNDTIFIRLTAPLGTGRGSYGTTISNNQYRHTLGYSDTVRDSMDSYSINVGASHGGDKNKQISAFYNHNSPLVKASVNASKSNGSFSSLGLNLSGGATVTSKGASLHAGGMNGGTRLLVDSDGVAGVPVDGGKVVTNKWGIGVVTDVSSYYRNSTSIALNKLPKDVEATNSIVESTLTEGAIGYRKFNVLKGNKFFAVLRMSDGSYPPFGALVSNSKGRELGIVSESGLAWLSGVAGSETLDVIWNGKTQCKLNTPDIIDSEQQYILPCHK